MTISAIAVVRCDFPACPNRMPVEVDRLVNDHVRVMAAGLGWAKRCASTRHEYDLCPVHADDVPGVTFPNWRHAPAS